MRVLLTPIGSAGDTFPFIALGRGLKRRGHDVTVATTDPFQDAVRSEGLEFVSTGSADEYRAATEDPDLFDPRRGYAAVMARVAEYNHRLFEILMTRQRQGDFVTVAHTCDFASRTIAEHTGLPVVRVHLQPTAIRTCHQMPVLTGTRDLSFLPRWLKRCIWWLVDRVVDQPIAPTVNEMRARLGLGSVRRVFVSQVDSPLLTLAMFPDWYAPPQPDWPRYIEQCDFPLYDSPGEVGLPADVEQYLGAGPPPLVFTSGSAMRHGHAFFEAAVGACSVLGRRGMLLTTHLHHVPARLPADVAHFDYAPLSAVLPRAAGVVHHGGIGTTAAAFAAGKPQVVVPFSHDQPDNANRVVGLGVGERIMPPRLNALRLAAALDDLLGADEVARRCRDITTKCAAGDGIGRACDLIESARTEN